MIEDYHNAVAEVVDVPLIAFQTNFAPYPKGAITALSRIKNVVAIKDASFSVDNTLANVKEAATAPRRIGVMTGSDTFILEAMLMGCDGALIGFAATATEALVQMQEYASAGRATEAYEIWEKLGLAGAHLLACAHPRLPRSHEVRINEARRAAELQGTRAVSRHSPEDRADIDAAFEQFDLGNSSVPAGRPCSRDFGAPVGCAPGNRGGEIDEHCRHGLVAMM